MQTTDHRPQRQIFDEKAQPRQNTLNRRFPARPGRSMVPSRHATKDEFARPFAAADAQLSTLRNPAR
jgi:hypothetical protein